MGRILPGHWRALPRITSHRAPPLVPRAYQAADPERGGPSSGGVSRDSVNIRRCPRNSGSTASRRKTDSASSSSRPPSMTSCETERIDEADWAADDDYHVFHRLVPDLHE